MKRLGNIEEKKITTRKILSATEVWDFPRKKKEFNVCEDNPVANTTRLLESPIGLRIYIVILRGKLTNHSNLVVNTITLSCYQQPLVEPSL